MSFKYSIFYQINRIILKASDERFIIYKKTRSLLSVKH